MVEITESESVEYAKSIAKQLCHEGNNMKYVLTALASAVQEQLGEDIILCPRKLPKKNTPIATTDAGVVTVCLEGKSENIFRHYIFYGTPNNTTLGSDELLKVTLDVAHELGHLLLERGPGRIPLRVGAKDSELERIREIEADWFALCILQMYGFSSLKLIN
jgi:Zn-dependent peptidase ImmA (M78 family)